MTFSHLQDLHVTAQFSENGQFRYRLSVEDPSCKAGKIVCVVMQNPSDADVTKADKSVQFLEHLIFNKAYVEFQDVRKMIIVNQYAYVQKHNFKGNSTLIGEKNNQIISDSIEKSDIILIAWGKNNPYQERKKFVFETLAKAEDKLLLETKKHPSRGFYKDFIKAFSLPELGN